MLFECIARVALFVIADRNTSFKLFTSDLIWIRRALAEAERGRGSVEPNPLVGAVVVRDGVLVGVGHHARFGGPHAEVEALAAAGPAAEGSTLYVTLEPCCHFGKTPPCTEAIRAAGIVRVVAAIADPFPEMMGRGFARLRGAGIRVDVGMEDQAARLLNAPYLKRQATGLPYVIAKWAMTLDGKMATASGESRWISSPRSRALVHELRGRMDAILVGIGTALADDPDLTARPPGPRSAARIVLDSTARLPLDGNLARTAGEVPVWVVVTDKAPDSRRAALVAKGCKIIALPGANRVPIVPLLEELGRREVSNLLVEGGGTVQGAFFDAGQVDAISVFVAPVVEGGAARFTPAQGRGHATISRALRLAHLEVSRIEDDVRIEGWFPRPWLGVEPP
jgi:diaminohydroxyphosphoribosylaminopyrimidine deaminase/5-amino-6-(5-phosphoribosylamino)uracil reductase